MGQPDLFAKRTFAEETERITGGGAAWQDPPEIRLEKVQGDGLLLIRHPALLAKLPAPWPAAQAHEEVLVELKLAGDHLDRSAVERALLRRQARQVQRVEEQASSWSGHEPLWLVAPHIPEGLKQAYTPARFGPGCYRVGPLRHCFVWVAANELPLRDALVPFLVARSGRPLDDFARWVAGRRSPRWVLTMLRYLAMSTTVRDDLLWMFDADDDPELEERDEHIVRVLLAKRPRSRERLFKEDVEKGVEKGIEQGIEQGRLVEARAALRRVLARRQLALGPDDEARIEACVDVAILERWHDQAITAASVSEALQ